MSRKKKQGAQGGADQSWMLTFSDMMTLLLTFFVLLFSMASTDSDNLNRALQALQNEFTVLDIGSMGEGNPPSGGVESVQLKNKRDEIKAAIDEMKQFITTEKLDDSVDVSRNERGIKVSISSDVMFASGSSVVEERLHSLLHRIAALATRLAKTVRVEGNTDRSPVTGGGYDSNLQLSGRRAENVLKVILEEKSFTPHGASIGAFGEFNPVYPEEASEDERKANRRVDVFITNPPDEESFWYALMQSYLDNANTKSR
ncbi:MAG: OmpA family protein [Candidatus Coatesbacteria bacterium]|nr:OmpA family protein [Candidatus Coatesbacteria bacterium]